MKKVSRIAWVVTVSAVIAGGMAGCEWGSPDDGAYWSDTYNWVNFSGVYKNPGGGAVVTDYTFTAPDDGSGTGPAVSVGPVTVATGNGGNSYSGTLLPNVVPGSLQITAGGVSFTDDSSGNLVPSSGLATMNGSISYDSGAWNVFLGGVAVPNGDPIRARYSVYQSTGTSGTGTGGTNKKKGTSSTTIYSLTAFQEGNLVRLVDSDGQNYEGRMGSLRSASGEMGNSPRAGDTVIAQFSVSGHSRVGMSVELTGTLQGTIATGGGNYVMTQRSMQGQWIEKNGKVGDIVGRATDSAISYTAPTTTDTTTP